MKTSAAKILLALAFVSSLTACGKDDEEKRVLIQGTDEIEFKVSISGDSFEVLENTESTWVGSSDLDANQKRVHDYCRFSIPKGTYSLKEFAGPYRITNESGTGGYLHNLIISGKFGAKSILTITKDAPIESGNINRGEHLGEVGMPFMWVSEDGTSAKLTRTCGLQLIVKK